MTSHVEHFSICIFYQSFCPFLNWIFLLLLSFRNSLYILYINSLSHLLFDNIFSHSVGFLFILLMESFDVHNFSLTHTLVQSHQPSLGCELPGGFHAFLFLPTPHPHFPTCQTAQGQEQRCSVNLVGFLSSFEPGGFPIVSGLVHPPRRNWQRC